MLESERHRLWFGAAEAIDGKVARASPVHPIGDHALQRSVTLAMLLGIPYPEQQYWVSLEMTTGLITFLTMLGNPRTTNLAIKILEAKRAKSVV